MLVNFDAIGELAFLVSFGNTIILDGGIMVDQYNFGQFITNAFDA